MDEESLVAEIRAALGIPDVVAYELDPRTGAMCFRGPVARILGGGVAVPGTIDDWLAHVVPADRPRARQALAERARSPNRVVYRLDRRDQPQLTVLDGGTPRGDGGILGIIGDVGGLLVARRAADRARRQLLDTERIAGVGHFELALETETLSCSDGVYKLLGEDPRGPTLTLERVCDLLVPADRATLRRDLDTILADARRTVERTVRIRAADGELRHAELRAEVVHDGGRRRALIGTARDVTALRRSTETLRRVERLQSRVLAELPLLMCSLDRGGRVITVSGRALTDAGVDPALLVGKRYDETAIIGADGRARIARALAGETVVETGVFLDRTYRIRWAPDRDEDGAIHGASGFALDLTDLEAADRKQREASEHLRTIAAHVGAVVWIASPRMEEVFYLSPTFERVFGFPAGHVIADPSRWLDAVHPDDRARVAAGIAACPWQQDQEHRIVWPDGTVRWIDVRVRPVHDARGEVISAVGIAEDVTDARAMVEDLRRTEAKLRRSLDDKVALLREVHHRVRNNLQIIQSLLALQARAVADPQVQRVLRDNQRRVQAMALVHESLLGASDLRELDLGAYLRRLLEALAATHGGGSARIQLRPEIGEATTDAQTAIHGGIAVAELVANAYEHGFPGGRGGVVRVTARVAAERLIVDVEDDGVGLPPGFCLDAVASLGLTLVRSLCGHVGGSLTAASPAGARFSLELPLRAP